jgi:hypothetical protein
MERERSLKPLSLAIALGFSINALSANAVEPNGPDFPMLVNIGGKCGYIDKKGSVVIPAKFNRADPFGSQGLAIVIVKGKRGLIDKTGKAILPPIYDDITENSASGLFKIYLKNKLGYADKNGKLNIPIIYDDLGEFGKAGLTKAMLGERELVIDKANTEVFEIPAGTRMGEFGDSEITSFSDVDSDLFGFADRKGNLVLPAIWDNAFGFGDGSIAAVEKDGKWGFIDKKGKVIVEPVYDFAFSAIFGTASVQIGDEWRDVDGQGNLMPIMETADGYAVGKFNSRGYAAAWKRTVGVGYQYGIVDKDLNWVLQPIFDELDVDEDPELYAAKRGKNVGYIDIKGQFVVTGKFSNVTGFNGTGIAVAYNGKNGGLIDRSGKWVLPPKFKALGFCKPPLAPPIFAPVSAVREAPPPTVRSD